MPGTDAMLAPSAMELADTAVPPLVEAAEKVDSPSAAVLQKLEKIEKEESERKTMIRRLQEELEALRKGKVQEGSHKRELGNEKDLHVEGPALKKPRLSLAPAPAPRPLPPPRLAPTPRLARHGADASFPIPAGNSAPIFSNIFSPTYSPTYYLTTSDGIQELAEEHQGILCTCGHHNGPRNLYCSQCGMSLH